MQRIGGQWRWQKSLVSLIEQKRGAIFVAYADSSASMTWIRFKGCNLSPRSESTPSALDDVVDLSRELRQARSPPVQKLLARWRKRGLHARQKPWLKREAQQHCPHLSLMLFE